MAMSPKENYLATLRHEDHEYIPNGLTSTIGAGFGMLPGPSFEKGPGMDGFGVNWLTPVSGGGAPIPEPGKFLLNADTIQDWKKIVKFPDLTKFDWEDDARQILSTGDPNLMAVDFGSGNGPFERMATLMGFEETLIAMAEEPEACRELADAIADFKCNVAECAKKYYHADTFTNYDDIATERALFMSPGTYREIIKPTHAKINKAVKDLGMIPVQHTCGKADDMVEDFIDTGAEAWTPVQSVNDIVTLLKNYGDRLAIIGGFNMNGAPGRPESTAEEMIAETERCYREYGFSKSYVFFGAKVVATMDLNEVLAAMAPIVQASIRFQQEYAFI